MEEKTKLPKDERAVIRATNTFHGASNMSTTIRIPSPKGKVVNIVTVDSVKDWTQEIILPKGAAKNAGTNCPPLRDHPANNRCMGNQLKSYSKEEINNMPQTDLLRH